MRVGSSWSDSSRTFSTIGSFFARICAATCSWIFEPDTWYGSAVMSTSPSPTSYTARARNEPVPVSYIARSSDFGVTISAPVGRSGPGISFSRSLSVASGSSSSFTQALATSRRLCGGMSVAMPTAMPVAPLRSTFGRRAGSSAGSSSVPSKFGVHSTVPCPSSASSVSAYGRRRDSV